MYELEGLHTSLIACIFVASRVPRLQFEYTAPTPGFDHSRVKGPVAKLIRLKDPATATALEVAAGGRVREDSTSITLCIAIEPT